MKFIATREFLKDFNKIKNQKIQNKLASLFQFIEKSNSPYDIPNIKPLIGHQNFFRIKIDHHYRIGCFYDGETLILKRLLTRESIYKKFP